MALKMAFTVFAAVLLVPSCFAAVISLPLEYALVNTNAFKTAANHDVAAQQVRPKGSSMQQTLSGQDRPRPEHAVEIWVRLHSLILFLLVH